MSRIEPARRGRRRFLKDTLRISLAGMLAFTGIILGSRKGSLRPGTSDCPPGSGCRNCPAFQACSDPQAEAFRDETEKIPPSPDLVREGEVHVR